MSKPEVTQTMKNSLRKHKEKYFEKKMQTDAKQNKVKSKGKQHLKCS